MPQPRRTQEPGIDNQPSEASPKGCLHCGTRLAPSEDRFCCAGCELAWELIHGAGLGSYYETREALPPRPEVLESHWTDVETEALDSGDRRLSCSVTGLRCASCVWVTERVLERTPGISAAHVSYSTGRATIDWDPSVLDLDGIVQKIATLGYGVRPLGTEPTLDRDLLTRLGVAAFCTANVMLMSASLYLGWLGPMEPGFAALFRWASLVLATPVVLWSAAPFFSTAWMSLKNGVIHMDLPIAIAVGGMYLHALVATVLAQDTYLDSATMLVTLLLVGRVLEARGRQSAARAAASLAAQLPTTVRRVRDGVIERVRPEDLEVGDTIEVAAGEEIGGDGVVVQGAGEARMAIVTGESDSIALQPGSRVVAGGVLEQGNIVVDVDRGGSETLVQQMALALTESLDRAEGEKPDPLAPMFTVATLALALVFGVTWTLVANLGEGLHVAVAVMVVACPCALSLARPLSLAAGLGAAARRGLMMRSGQDLEALAGVDTVALDKTGTVTLGKAVVTEASDEALAIASALERASIHPIARAIVRATIERGIPLARAESIEEVPGKGIRGVLNGKLWTIGAGAAGVVLLRSEEHCHQIRLTDAVRSDAYDLVESLKNRGLDVAILTGDQDAVATKVAEALGVQNLSAQVQPLEKAAWVQEQQAQGRSVLFVGDGLNDGPALAAADVGLAMEGGAGSTILAGQGVVAGGHVSSIVAGFRAAKEAIRALRRSRQRAVLYNVVAVSGAAAGWVNPLVAAILMPISSLLVVWESSQVERRVQAGSSPIQNATGGPDSTLRTTALTNAPT